jgi:hypothetical protein
MTHERNENNEPSRRISLSSEAIEALDGLFESAPPRELREHILEIYHTYLIHAHYGLLLDFEKLARNMYMLVGCLGTLEEEEEEEKQKQNKTDGV